MFRHLPLILKNSWRNRRRTVLTILSVGVSLCLLGLMMAIYHAFYFSTPSADQELRITTRNRVSLTLPMPQSYAQKIKELPGVREVEIEQWFGGVYIDSRPEHMFARMAVEPDKFFTIYPDVKIDPDQEKAFQHERSACIVGREVADKLHWKLGDRITIKGDIFPVNLEFTLRGVFDAQDAFMNRSLYFDREYLEQSLPLGRRGNAGTFTTLAASTDDVPRIEAAVDEEFRNSPVQTKTETQSAFGLSFLALLGNIKAILLTVCAALTFTILLVSANTISMSVRERVREVGILKTLGFTTSNILSIIVGEAVFIAGAGGVLGSLMAAFLCDSVRRFPMTAGFFHDLTFSSGVAAAALGVALFIGLVSSLAPAWGAAKTSILDSLRYTG